MHNIKDIEQDRMRKYGKFDGSEIDTRFLPFLHTDKRIEVTWKKGFEDYSGYGCRTDGRKARFTVGISTGWKPILLQIYSKRSSGGSAILSSAVESIKEL